MSDPKSQHFYTINSSTSPYRIDHNLENRNLLTKIKKSAQSYENYTREVEFRVHNTDDESGPCSPPLWKSSTTSNHGNLSPNSRTRAIAKGQEELMEMVRNMPESCYELSLRDMVLESPKVENPELEDEKRCLVDEKNLERRKSIKEILKKQDSKKIDKKVEKVKSAKLGNEGFLLKMMFPISIGSKKKNNLPTNTSKKVSPRVETLGKLPSISEKDWWKKRFMGSSGSESCVTNTSASSKSTSSSDNSNNSRRSKGWTSGCWSFPFLRKSKRKSK